MQSRARLQETTPPVAWRTRRRGEAAAATASKERGAGAAVAVAWPTLPTLLLLLLLQGRWPAAGLRGAQQPSLFWGWWRESSGAGARLPLAPASAAFWPAVNWISGRAWEKEGVLGGPVSAGLLPPPGTGAEKKSRQQGEGGGEKNLAPMLWLCAQRQASGAAGAGYLYNERARLVCWKIGKEGGERGGRVRWQTRRETATQNVSSPRRVLR